VAVTPLSERILKARRRSGGPIDAAALMTATTARPNTPPVDRDNLPSWNLAAMQQYASKNLEYPPRQAKEIMVHSTKYGLTPRFFRLSHRGAVP
jgi:hypothetical protein